MSGADPKSAYQAVIRAIGPGDTASLAELLAPDLVDHNAVPGQPAGLAGFLWWAQTARAAFPDLAGTVEDAVAEGDKVAGRVTWRGTHRGTFLGVPGTGAPVEFAAFHIVRFVGGRATEWWGTGDLLGALLQVGASVTPPPAGARSR